MTREHDQDHSSGPNDLGSEFYRELKDNAGLPLALDSIAETLKCLMPDDSELGEKVLAVQRACEEQVRAELTSPIKGWDDFKVRLVQIEQAHKRSRFDSNLRIAAGELYAFLRRIKDSGSGQNREEVPEYWKAQILLYELNDIFHLSKDINADALNVGKRIQYELFDQSDRWDDDKEFNLEQLSLTRQKVIYCAYRGNQLKRTGDAEGAQKLLEWLLEFTDNKLAHADPLQSWEVLAYITYNLGSVYRVLEKHDRAEEMFTRTLECLRKRTEEPDGIGVDDYFFNVRQQAMVVGIGYGGVNLTRGFLRRAENALTTARALLAHIRDPIISPYIDLLYGTIKRCRAGRDRELLQEAIDILRRVRDDFQKHNHDRYVPRACWELSLAFNLMGDDEQTQKHLDAVATYADQTKHPKWQTNVRILRSRRARRQGDYKAALAEAEGAVEKARACRSVLPLMDAYITRGEAHLYTADKSDQRKSKYLAARRDFDNALRLVLELGLSDPAMGLPSNPKIAAVCSLRIAQCHAREGNEMKAREHYKGWEILRSNVEHEFVRELAAQVKDEIDSLSKNFTISASEQSQWNYAENVASLRRWLLTQALRATKNYTDAAKLLGVQRATLYQWQEDAHSQSKRARTSRGGDTHAKNVRQD